MNKFATHPESTSKPTDPEKQGAPSSPKSRKRPVAQRSLLFKLGMAAGSLLLLGAAVASIMYVAGVFNGTPTLAVPSPISSVPNAVPLAEPTIAQLFRTQPLAAVTMVFQKHRAASVAAVVFVCCVVAAVVVAVVLVQRTTAAAAIPSPSPALTDTLPDESTPSFWDRTKMWFTDHLGAAIGGIVGTIAFIALVIVAVFFVKSRLTTNSANVLPEEEPEAPKPPLPSNVKEEPGSSSNPAQIETLKKQIKVMYEGIKEAASGFEERDGWKVCDTKPFSVGTDFKFIDAQGKEKLIFASFVTIRPLWYFYGLLLRNYERFPKNFTDRINDQTIFYLKANLKGHDLLPADASGPGSNFSIEFVNLQDADKDLKYWQDVSSTLYEFFEKFKPGSTPAPKSSQVDWNQIEKNIEEVKRNQEELKKKWIHEKKED